MTLCVSLMLRVPITNMHYTSKIHADQEMEREMWDQHTVPTDCIKFMCLKEGHEMKSGKMWNEQ